MGRVVFFLRLVGCVNNIQSLVPEFGFLGTSISRISELQKKKTCCEWWQGTHHCVFCYLQPPFSISVFSKIISLFLSFLFWPWVNVIYSISRSCTWNNNNFQYSRLIRCIKNVWPLPLPGASRQLFYLSLFDIYLFTQLFIKTTTLFPLGCFATPNVFLYFLLLAFILLELNVYSMKFLLHILYLFMRFQKTAMILTSELSRHIFW